MRQRLRPFRDRAMARRAGEDGARFSLSPRTRLMAGWIGAVAIIGIVAFVVGAIGGNADGQPVVATPAASATAGVSTITFGTALDSETAQVPDASRTDRFAAGDTFAYSVPPTGAPPTTVYVEVERTAGGPAGIVQEAVPGDGEQSLPQGRPAIGFSVPADNLLAAWGPGQYVMRIYEEPEGEPIAAGSFTLVGPPATEGTAPAASP